jgi:hypothetical protein
MPSRSRQVINHLESVLTSVLFDVCVGGAGRCLLLERSLKLLLTANDIYIYIYIYINITAIGLTLVAAVHHTFTQTIHKIQRKENLGSAGCAPSLRVIPWHLPYN